MSHQLMKSMAVTGGMTLVSRISGLVRDMIFARMIGAGAGVAADAFYVAFRIPNFLRRIFGEGAFSQAFIPIFSEYRARDDLARTREFVSHVTGILSITLVIVTAIGTLAAPLVVLILAPGYLANLTKYHLTVQMLRIMFPYLLFISLVSMASGILNTFGRFAIPAFTPVLLNLSMIAAALWLAPHMAQPVIALAVGVFIAGILQLLFQLPALKQLHLLPRPQISLKDEGVRRMFKLMLPGVFSVSVAQINLLINTILASFLVTGSVSWLYYSDRLMEFPLGIFGVALATVILPNLSQKHAQKSAAEFSHTLDWALRIAFTVSIPATVGLILLGKPLLITLFQRGAFKAHDVDMAFASLIAFAIGLTPFILIKILAPGFYARQQMRYPVRVGMIAIGVDIIISLSLIYFLKHVALALSTSLAAFVNAGLLFYGLRKEQVYVPLPGWIKFLMKIIFSSIIMGLILWFMPETSLVWLHASTLQRVSHLAFWLIIGMLVYITVMFTLGVRPHAFMLKQVDQTKEVSGNE